MVSYTYLWSPLITIPPAGKRTSHRLQIPERGGITPCDVHKRGIFANG